MINWVIRAPLLVTFVLTFGFETFFVSLGRVVFTNDQRAVSPTYNAAALVIGDTIINWMKLAAFAIALAVTGACFCSCATPARGPRSARWAWTPTLPG